MCVCVCVCVSVRECVCLTDIMCNGRFCCSFIIGESTGTLRRSVSVCDSGVVHAVSDVRLVGLFARIVYALGALL